MNISELLDKAKREAGASSERDLERRTGIGASRFSSYRHGRMLPSDEAMLKLCEAAKVDPIPWLIWLNAQRTSGETRAAYERHLAQLSNKKSPNSSEVIAA